MYSSMYKERNGTELARGHDFGADRPSQDWIGELDQLDQIGRGLERNGPDRTGPDWIGLNRRDQLLFGREQTSLCS